MGVSAGGGKLRIGGARGFCQRSCLETSRVPMPMPPMPPWSRGEESYIFIGFGKSLPNSTEIYSVLRLAGYNKLLAENTVQHREGRKIFVISI